MDNSMEHNNKTLSIIIPALNEAHGIGHTINAIPKGQLERMGYNVEVLVVDNGSDDGTAEIARRAGAEVIHEPKRGYGSAYKAGFANAKGEIIATTDADATYPIDDIPRLLSILENEHIDFLTTNRLATLKKGTMPLRNKIGNKILSLSVMLLYWIRLRDPESGMWILRKEILKNCILKCDTWPFSHELKLEACYFNNNRWQEISIEYRCRIGKTKLLAGWRVGLIDLFNVIKKRFIR